MEEDPPNLKKSDSIDDEWKEASSKRLLASGYFKTIQSMVTGMLQWVWGMIILPRIVTVSEPSGIIAIVSAYLGLIGSFFDWGINTGLQVVLSKSIPAHDDETTVRYVKTFITFRIISGTLYTILVGMVIIFWFGPTFQNEWKTAYYWAIFFLTIPSLWGFSSITDLFIVASQRFDYDFYYSFFSFWMDVGLKLFLFWICITLFSDKITAFTVALVIVSMVESIGNPLIQVAFLNKLKIITWSKILKIGIDRDALKHLVSFGAYVWGRGYLMYCSEQSSFLWIFFATLFVPSPEAIIGYWGFALGGMGFYLMAENLMRPILPAIAEAHGKNDLTLLQAYWNTTMKWNFLWSWFSLGFYLGGGVIYIVAFSGSPWYTAGLITIAAAPAYFFKTGNDYFVAILNALNKPHKPLIGSALKIPFLVFGGLLLFKLPFVNVINWLVNIGLVQPPSTWLPSDAYGIIGMAITFIMIEAAFYIYAYYQIAHILHISTPAWIIIIPGISMFIGLFLMRYVMGFVLNYETNLVMQFIFLFVLYSAFFFLPFIWLGGFEVKDYEEFYGSIKMVVRNEKIAKFLVGGIQNLAKISPLYGRFKSQSPTPSEDLKNEEHIE